MYNNINLFPIEKQKHNMDEWGTFKRMDYIEFYQHTNGTLRIWEHFNIHLTTLKKYTFID